MAHPYLALRPTRNGRVSHYAVAGSKNPLPLGMGSVKGAEIRRGVDEHLVDGIGVYVLRRDVAQVHLIDACAVVHVKGHTGRCHDVVYGEIWIVGQFGRVMRRSCELSARCVEAAHAVSCFDFLYDFEKPCSSWHTI